MLVGNMYCNFGTIGYGWTHNEDPFDEKPLETNRINAYIATFHPLFNILHFHQGFILINTHHSIKQIKKINLKTYLYMPFDNDFYINNSWTINANYHNRAKWYAVRSIIVIKKYQSY